MAMLTASNRIVWVAFVAVVATAACSDDDGTGDAGPTPDAKAPDAGDARSSDTGDASSPDTGDAPSPDTGDVPPAHDSGDAPPAGCLLEASSDLPGVSIRFTGTTCTFTTAQARAGITIPYEVRIDQDISDVLLVPVPGSFCYQPGPSGLLILERLTGGSHQYCLCDQGLPIPTPCSQLKTLRQGTYNAAFTWDGVNWSGPSDTNNPKGAPFPAGEYRLEVTAKGRKGPVDASATAFTVTAAFRVTLTN
jgi:hypothetical protein